MKLFRAMSAEEYMKLQNGEKLVNQNKFLAGDGFFFFGENVLDYNIDDNDLKSIGLDIPHNARIFIEKYFKDENQR